MSHKINYVYPTSILISWMQTITLILSIYNVLMKARFLQPSTQIMCSSFCVSALDYMSQFWHTLKIDGSKYKFKFFLNTKELTMTVADFRCVFQLLRATDNNHVGFVDAPTFSKMVSFFRNALGRLYYFLTHPTTLIPYPSFMKIIIDHYMTEHSDISRRVHENYHGVKHDDLVKNIFNSRKNKEGTGMKIPEWMLTEEMKLTAHYQMYAVVFQVDVPMTQSQPIESTQGTWYALKYTYHFPIKTD
nr:hypothetical protein [Tanacetum cinerariifolium]GEZ24527.1 hypothetical protein [Tanacetum cinerariifolium]